MNVFACYLKEEINIERSKKCSVKSTADLDLIVRAQDHK